VAITAQHLASRHFEKKSPIAWLRGVPVVLVRDKEHAAADVTRAVLRPRQPVHDRVVEVELGHGADDGLVLEESLEGRQEDMIVVKVWRGRLRKAFDVRPGNRRVRLEVAGDGFGGTQRIDARLERGETRRLEVRLGGLIRKELTAWWGPRSETPDSDR
jgi:hypothetical protein